MSLEYGIALRAARWIYTLLYTEMDSYADYV